MDATTPRCGARWLLLGLVLVTVSVPLVPFRYLVLPVPGGGWGVAVVQHLPTALCMVLGSVWVWQQCQARWQCAGWRQWWPWRHWQRSRRHAAEEATGEATGAATGAAVGAKTHGRTPVGGVPLAWPVLTLLLVGLLSAAGARYPLASVGKSLYYFVTGGMLYLVVVGGMREVRPARLLLGCALGAGYATALYGLVEFRVGGNPLFAAFFSGGNAAYRCLVPDPWFEGRITATVGHPVVLGAYLALLLPVSLAATAATTSGPRRAGLAVGTVLLAAALLLTFSRGAWLAAAVGVGVFVRLRGVRGVLLVPVVMAVAAVGVLAVGGGSAIRRLAVPRLQAAYSDYVCNFGATTRGAGYGYVAAIADAHPLTGLGTGMYRFAAYDLRRTLDLSTPVGVLDTPDNMYLVWLAENGGVGLVAAVYVLVCLLQLFWRRSRAGAPLEQRILAGGFLAAWVSLAVNLLTVDALYFPVLRTVSWVLAGVGVVLVGGVPRMEAGSDTRPRVAPGTDQRARPGASCRAGAAVSPSTAVACLCAPRSIPCLAIPRTPTSMAW